LLLVINDLMGYDAKEQSKPQVATAKQLQLHALSDHL